MEQLVTLFADIKGSKSRDEYQSNVHPQSSHTKDARDTRESRDARESRRARETSRSARDPSRAAKRDTSVSTRNSTRDARESRDFKDVKDPRDFKETKDSRELRDSRDSRELRDSGDYRDSRDYRDPRDYRDSRDSREFKDSKDVKEFRDSKESRHSKEVKDFKSWEESEPAPPPYQEIADAAVQTPTVQTPIVQTPIAQTPIEFDEPELQPTHLSGVTPTAKCVNEFISVPVDWVIHPSAPHFVICGRCYIDRIYPTQQWRREFVKYRPIAGVLLRCHLGAIPHMEKRWSRVHTPEDFLSFLKVMQRKKVAKPCPGDTYPRSNTTWYTTPSISGLRICQECRQRLFGGTVFSKHFAPTDTSVSSICHGSFPYTNRVVDQLLQDEDWDRFAEGMRIRIRLPGCPNPRDVNTDDNIGWWYKCTKSSVTRDLYICETCFVDHAYKTDKENYFSISDRLASKPRCMASLKENQLSETADVEYNRAEIMRILHGTDRRCYAQGTVGLKWYTTLNNPREYGVCEGCYLSKIKPIGGEDCYVPKRDVGKRTAFACWMNSYHPFFRRHQQLLHEALIVGDLNRLENSIRKFSKLPGCQQGGMGQGKNKRWWGWRCLRICGACMKGGNLADTSAAKRFELHGDKDPYHRVCDLYSMQLRDHFHHEDVGKLLELARRRQEMML
jgi:hypothetical protein